MKTLYNSLIEIIVNKTIIIPDYNIKGILQSANVSDNSRDILLSIKKDNNNVSELKLSSTFFLKRVIIL